MLSNVAHAIEYINSEQKIKMVADLFPLLSVLQFYTIYSKPFILQRSGEITRIGLLL